MKSIDHEVKSLDACPVCGVDHDGYNTMDFDGENIYLRFTCPDCGCYHVETYAYKNTWFETFE